MLLHLPEVRHRHLIVPVGLVGLASDRYSVIFACPVEGDSRHDLFEVVDQIAVILRWLARHELLTLHLEVLLCLLDDLGFGLHLALLLQDGFLDVLKDLALRVLTFQDAVDAAAVGFDFFPSGDCIIQALTVMRHAILQRFLAQLPDLDRPTLKVSG